ncbi:hypothetical protein [Serinibacter salmoneus]|uniref:Lipoprotein antigen n=1 Tax=Serinibacter salmoneus TaxID=556530 RepID=A0A2A9D2K7_9MICO|nr:hypothetical protein [Serinibacter salmoneus]PFG20100.1 hypothetical protein ATL40_1683 [Serinibacter salmoneus]
MKTVSRGFASLAIATLMLSGCSSSSHAPDLAENSPDESTVSEEDSHEDSTAGEVADGERASIMGTVRVNDLTTYAITEVRNCEPLNDGTIERELELQGFGEHDGERIQIDVYKQMVAGSAGNEVSWSGPEGVFGSSGVANITWGSGDANVLGSSEMVDSMTQTERLMIGFDLQVPVETVPCR